MCGGRALVAISLTLTAGALAQQSQPLSEIKPHRADSAAVQQGEKPSAPTVSTADQQRISDWVGVIEGQNTPAARLIAARELLRLNAAEANKRLAAILTGSNRTARVAVSLALAETPLVDGSLVAPLIALLGDDDADARAAAAAAIAKGGAAAIDRLSELLNDAQQPQGTKLAAIDALGRMTRREAIQLLMAALADPASPLCTASLEALERATAQEFQGDLSAAQRWWEETRGADASAWQQIQFDRLVRQSGVLGQRVRELETRLSTVLRENFFRAAEGDRTAILISFLSDSGEVVRLLGLELVQSQITEGKPLAAETITKMREMFDAPEPRVRAAAVRTAASLRDKTDADRFIEQLSVETNGDVRQALIYGLGYVGGPGAVQPLLAFLAERDRATADEAITALGRVAERPGLDAPTRERVGTALLERLSPAPASQPVANRERLIRAMSRLPDRRFAPIFVEALAPAEAPAIRLAAVRGVALLADPRVTDAAAASQAVGTNGDVSDGSRKLLVEALMKATGDGDIAVRKAAVEALAGLATSDAQLQTLWNRLSAAQEPDEGVRTAAWRGVTRVLATRPPAEIEAWVDRLPENGAARGPRAVELYQLAEKQAAAANASRGDLGRIRARIGAQRVAMNQPGEAMAAYAAALDDLNAAQSPEAANAAAELVTLAVGVLRANPADESARTSIMQLGTRAVPALREALRSAIAADSASPTVERALHDLLRAALPEWQGFAPDASASDKLRALERINA